ncbi:MAG TPA: sigma 54-interacting transcriptional regulator [Steroidobacteraceae bacterium]|jgi:two-component system response regulator GlrR|nr:sigma 54-interacting transcriptional regulator [Steroidobacteraceae bacterium]
MKDKPKHSVASLGFGIAPPSTESLDPRGKTAALAARRPKILIVDPDLALRRLMEARLGSSDYEIQSAGGAQGALDAGVRNRPNLVITDLHLPDMDGIAFLKELKCRWPLISVIVLTAHGTIPEAVQATQCGAFGYLVKPIEREEFLGQVQRAIFASTFNPNDVDLRAKFASRNQLMQDRLSTANRAAGSDVPVLLTGENGTGKELLARAIHAASPRRDQPFVVVRCKGRAPEDLRADLLGSDSQGRLFQKPALQRAQGGSLLIDEIADLPTDLQVALARALANPAQPSTQPLRSTATPPFKSDRVAQVSIDTAAPRDARLICTTSRDLQTLADCGVFFRDLLNLINILPIEIPPLGRRREDIPLLISHFLEQAIEPGGQTKIYSPQAIELLATTDWPGNVRQLFELVKQHVALSHSKIMSKEFVQRSLGEQSASLPAYDEARDKFSRDFLAENLQRAGGNVTKAARLAKRSRTDFYKLLARHRLDAEDFKEAGAAGPLAKLKSK